MTIEGDGLVVTEAQFVASSQRGRDAGGSCHGMGEAMSA